ncbi:MAG TPA: hypothetical protein VKE22_13720 [Haliangiales bacterium]|nr:hypothetical protein [Haliangiales bacterium]
MVHVRKRLNRAAATAVQRAVVYAFAGLCACVDVNGGAVELSWSLRTDTGIERTCPQTAIVQVALCMRDCDTQPCAGALACPNTFPCERQRGTTQFDIPPGRKEITIRPDCASGPALVVVPPPLVRDIVKGDVTELNALLITVPSAGAICP